MPSLVYTPACTFVGSFAGGINCLAISPDATLLASGGSDNRLLIFDLPRESLLYDIIATGPILSLEWIEITNQLVCGVGDGTVFVVTFHLVRVSQPLYFEQKFTSEPERGQFLRIFGAQSSRRLFVFGNEYRTRRGLPCIKRRKFGAGLDLQSSRFATFCTGNGSVPIFHPRQDLEERSTCTTAVTYSTFNGPPCPCYWLALVQVDQSFHSGGVLPESRSSVFAFSF
jgi:WD40 repeat protein